MQCYVVLRQSYLQNSEQQVNEWHRQFLEKRAAQQGAGDKDDRASTRSVRSMRSGWMKDAVNNLNPNRQVVPPWRAAALSSILKRKGSSRHIAVTIGSLLWWHQSCQWGFWGGAVANLGLCMLQMGCIEEGLEDVIAIGHGNRGQSNMAWRRLE